MGHALMAAVRPQIATPDPTLSSWGRYWDVYGSGKADVCFGEWHGIVRVVACGSSA